MYDELMTNTKKIQDFFFRWRMQCMLGAYGVKRAHQPQQ